MNENLENKSWSVLENLELCPSVYFGVESRWNLTLTGTLQPVLFQNEQPSANKRQVTLVDPISLGCLYILTIETVYCVVVHHAFCFNNVRGFPEECWRKPSLSITLKKSHHNHLLLFPKGPTQFLWSDVLLQSKGKIPTFGSQARSSVVLHFCGVWHFCVA